MPVRDGFYDLVHAVGSRRFWLTVAVTTVGLGLHSVGINALVVPPHLVPSGATGVALLLSYLSGWGSVGVFTWLVNLPILLVGWRAMSLGFVVLALVGVGLSGMMLELTQGVRIPTDDPLMAAVLAGTLTGGGCGLYLRFGGSAGGIDILAAVARRRWGLPMGTTFLALNGLIFALGAWFNQSLERAFYTAIALAVHAKVIDLVQGGFSGRKAALIVTHQPHQVAEHIMRRLRRGVTFLDGAGGMTATQLKIVYTVVNVVEVARLKELIFHTDPEAFVTLTDASEVIGKRFLSWGSMGFQPAPAAPAGSAPRRGARAG